MGDIHIAGTWRTTAPPEDVWAVISDLGTWPAWWPAISAAEVLDGDGDVPDAARLVFDTPAPLRPLAVEVEVTDRQVPSRLAVAPRGGPLGGTGRLEIAAEGPGAAVDYDLRLRIRSRWFLPLEAVLAGATRGAGRERLRQAGDQLAALAGGEPGWHEP